MLHGMTNLQAVQMIAVMFLIGMGVCVLALFMMLFAPDKMNATLPPWESERYEGGELAHELGSYAYREPADPEHVEYLIRAYGRAAVIHSPDTQPVDNWLLPANNEWVINPYALLGRTIDDEAPTRHRQLVAA